MLNEITDAVIERKSFLLQVKYKIGYGVVGMIRTTSNSANRPFFEIDLSFADTAVLSTENLLSQLMTKDVVIFISGSENEISKVVDLVNGQDFQKKIVEMNAIVITGIRQFTD